MEWLPFTFVSDIFTDVCVSAAAAAGGMVF
jgi:hypothetical protein